MLYQEQTPTLVIRAEAVYRGVVADPARYDDEAAAVVDAARRAGDTEALVVALRARAWAARARLAHGEAKDGLDEAARIARRHHHEQRLGEVLVSRAAVHLELGRVAGAQRDLERAATLLGTGGHPELDLQQAVLHHNLGRLVPAAAGYQRVLADPGAAHDVTAKVANNLAMIQAQRGRYDEALALLDTAAASAAAAGPALIAIVTQTRGWVTVQRGDLPEGLQRFDRAADLYRRAGLSLGEHYLERVDALLALRLVPEARADAERARAAFAAEDVALMGAETDVRLARLELDAGDPERAVVLAAEAAARFRRQGRPSWRAVADALGIEARARTGALTAADAAAARRAASHLQRHGLASLAVEAHLTAGTAAQLLGHPGPARHSYATAAGLARRGPLLVRVKGRVAAARSAHLAGDSKGVLTHSRRGLADLDHHRGALASMELRALASGHGVELGHQGLRVAVADGSPALALEWMERTRAAALVTLDPPLDPAGRDQLALLRVVHDELAQARATGEGEPSLLLTRQAALEADIRRATWAQRSEGGTTPRGVRLRALRALLAGATLAEYAVVDGEVVAVVVGARRSRLVALGPVAAVAAEADGVAFALRRLTRPGPAVDRFVTGLRAGGERLRALLVAPLGLDADEPLVAVPPPEVGVLPWSALHPGPVVVAPSAHLWARATAAPVVRGTVVLVAGPGLAGARAEIAALAPLHAGAVVLEPPASTVDAVAAAMDGARLVHLACHGRLRADNPMFSALELSDGPLTVHELDRRGVAPDRVILAACESGADVAYRGGEVLGFAGTLLARGVTGLIASPVVVDDAAVVDLMRVVHTAVAVGASLPDALVEGRRALDPADPRAVAVGYAFNAYGAR